ncbi:MAG: caspase domain-containing protein [Candidatus Methylumidiphilus sp.]
MNYVTRNRFATLGFLLLALSGCGIDVRLSSNQPDTTFIVDGKEYGPFQRQNIEIPENKKKEHKILAKKDGYCDYPEEEPYSLAPEPYFFGILHDYREPVEFEAFLTENKDCVCPLCANPLEIGNYYALVIGNNYDTPDSRLGKDAELSSPRNDADAVAALLKDTYGYDVKVLKDAKKEDILEALQSYVDLFKGSNQANNLLIYYAGHGDNHGEVYWLPADADTNNSATWLSDTEITKRIKQTDAKHIIVISDSCFSNKPVNDTSNIVKPPHSMEAAMVTKEYLYTWNPQKGTKEYQYKSYLLRKSVAVSRTAFTSGGNEPVSDRCPGIRDGHSCFAHIFLDELQKNQGVLEGSRLAQAVKSRMRKMISNQEPRYGIIPRAGDEDIGGDFLFIKK